MKSVPALVAAQNTAEVLSNREATGAGTETVSNWSRDLVKAIAMDIGKDTVAYIEVMYPKAIEATSSTFKLSVRNHIYNEIMAAIEVNEEGQITARIKDRKAFRRWWVGAYRKLRRAKTFSRHERTDT